MSTTRTHPRRRRASSRTNTRATVKRTNHVKPEHAQRARRYLQASMHAGYTGMPDEHREAYESQMREHERHYPDVRTHALVGQDQDFDEPLTKGEREHQRHLRREEGLTESQVLERRRELRAPRTPAPRPTPRTTRPARRAPTIINQLTGPAAKRGGELVHVIAVGIGLSLLYLLLSKNGTKAITLGLSGITRALDALIAPIDPLTGSAAGAKHAEGRLEKEEHLIGEGETQPAPGVLTPAGESIRAGARKIERRREHEVFGKGPLNHSPFPPIGG